MHRVVPALGHSAGIGIQSGVGEGIPVLGGPFVDFLPVGHAHFIHIDQVGGESDFVPGIIRVGIDPVGPALHPLHQSIHHQLGNRAGHIAIRIAHHHGVVPTVLRTGFVKGQGGGILPAYVHPVSFSTGR